MKEIIRICKGCNKLFKKEARKQEYCTKKCCYSHHKDIRRVVHKKGRYLVENAVKRKPFDAPKEFKLELRDFIFELKNKCYFVDAVDSFKLIHYFVELWGIWYFDRLTMEEELHLCLEKCKRYVQNEFKLEKI